MAQKRNDPKPKPVEEWSVKEWEEAYNVLMKRYDLLKGQMKDLSIHLNKALAQLYACV